MPYRHLQGLCFSVDTIYLVPLGDEKQLDTGAAGGCGAARTAGAVGTVGAAETDSGAGSVIEECANPARRHACLRNSNSPYSVGEIMKREKAAT